MRISVWKEHWSVDTFKEMKKVQISSETLLPSISFMDESIIEDDYFKVAADVFKDKYAKELSSPKTYGGAMHEIVWGGFGIANSVKYWTLLNAKANCTFLPMDMEQQMLGKVFGSTTDKGYSNFSDIITAIIPDISEYSWDEIIEIRHHNYWTQFRKKLTELSESIEDKKLGQDILEEIVRKDLIEMAQRFRPQVTKNIVKGVVSNIPLPIPINPVSVVCTGYDIIPSLTLARVESGYRSRIYAGCSHFLFGNDLCYFFTSSVLVLFIMLRMADFEINS